MLSLHIKDLTAVCKINSYNCIENVTEALVKGDCMLAVREPGSFTGQNDFLENTVLMLHGQPTQKTEIPLNISNNTPPLLSFTLPFLYLYVLIRSSEKAKQWNIQ